MTTLEHTIAEVARWLEPAVALHRLGQPIVVSFSPGDGTKYVMAFTPAAATREFETHGEWPALRPGLSVLALVGPSPCATIIDGNGSPFPGYVATHLKLTNRCTIAAVGVCWALMVGNSADDVAAMYADPDSREAIADWENYR